MYNGYTEYALGNKRWKYKSNKPHSVGRDEILFLIIVIWEFS